MYINNKYKHSEITGRIIKCSIKVHNKMGSGFKEHIYQRALMIELEKERLNFVREHEMDVYYDDQIIGKRRVDFLIENVVIIELKAVTKLEDIFKNQIINYLEVSNLDIGMLINFGKAKLEFKRFINEKNNQRNQR